MNARRRSRLQAHGKELRFLSHRAFVVRRRLVKSLEVRYGQSSAMLCYATLCYAMGLTLTSG